MTGAKGVIRSRNWRRRPSSPDSVTEPWLSAFQCAGRIRGAGPAPLYMTAGVLTALLAVLIYATRTGTRLTVPYPPPEGTDAYWGDCND